MGSEHDILIKLCNLIPPSNWQVFMAVGLSDPTPKKWGQWKVRCAHFWQKLGVFVQHGGQSAYVAQWPPHVQSVQDQPLSQLFIIIIITIYYYYYYYLFIINYNNNIWWIIGLILHGGPIDLFLVPAIAPRLV